MSEKIITLNELKELVNENKTHLIRMNLYSFGQLDYKSEKITNVVIDDHGNYATVNWSWNGGDPCVELIHDNKIKKIYDSSSSDYRYTLFIE